MTLDESLFDDSMDFDADIDSDLYEMPETDIDSGMADTLMSLINDEWEAIKGYNNFAAVCRGTGMKDDDPILIVIKDIVAEENKHVGQLQEILKSYSPNAQQIAVGEKEAKTQLSSMISGIKFWDDSEDRTPAAAPVSEDECCTIVDVDDEF